MDASESSSDNANTTNKKGNSHSKIGQKQIVNSDVDV